MANGSQATGGGGLFDALFFNAIGQGDIARQLQPGIFGGGQVGQVQQQASQQQAPGPGLPSMAPSFSTPQDPYAPWLRPDIATHTQNVLSVMGQPEARGFQQLDYIYGMGTPPASAMNPEAYIGLRQHNIAPMAFPNQYNIPKYSQDMGLQQNLDAGSQFWNFTGQPPYSQYQSLAPVPLGALATGGSGMTPQAQPQQQQFGGAGGGQQFGGVGGQQFAFPTRPAGGGGLPAGLGGGGFMSTQGQGVQPGTEGFGPFPDQPGLVPQAAPIMEGRVPWNERYQTAWEAQIKHVGGNVPQNIPGIRDFGSGIRNLRIEGDPRTYQVQMQPDQGRIFNVARQVGVDRILGSSRDQLIRQLDQAAQSGQLNSREVFGVEGILFGPRSHDPVAFFGASAGAPKSPGEAGSIMGAYGLMQDALKQKLGAETYNRYLTMARGGE